MKFDLREKDLNELNDNNEIIRNTKKLCLCKCKDDFNVLSNYINLTKLILIDCDIKSIPSNLIKLEELNIYYEDEDKNNFITEIPKTLINLKNLTIRDKNIKEIPNTLKNLEELSITCSSINTIPDNFINLKYINLYDYVNKITIPSCYKDNVIISNTY